MRTKGQRGPGTSRTHPRILQVIPTVSKHYGGPAIGAIALNRALAALGADALLLSTSYMDGSGARLSREEQDDLAVQGINVVLSAPSRPFSLENSVGLLMRTLRHARSADLIHINGQYMLPCVYAYLAARIWRTPYGLQVHGTLEPYQRRVSATKKKIYNTLIGTSIIKRATYVHFASLSEAQRASDVVRPDQVIVRPLGAELPDAVAPTADGLVKQIERVPRNARFLYLGRFATKKRPGLLLRAWASSNASKSGVLIMAGPDGAITSIELKCLAEELGITSSVVFVGSVDGPEKSWLYRNAGTFILPSANENFAITIGEAMLAGCHVITTPEVAASSFLVTAGAGDVIDGMDESSLSNALDTALDDPVRSAQSGRIAKAFASENMTWKPLATYLLSTAKEEMLS